MSAFSKFRIFLMLLPACGPILIIAGVIFLIVIIFANFSS